MNELLSNLQIFVITLSIKLKLLSESEFAEFLEQLDYQQKIYAMWLRYFV